MTLKRTGYIVRKKAASKPLHALLTQIATCWRYMGLQTSVLNPDVIMNGGEDTGSISTWRPNITFIIVSLELTDD